MTPVDQIHLNHGTPGEPNGDCFRACLASLLDKPTLDVPHFFETWTNEELWIHNLQDWLRPLGLWYLDIAGVPFHYLSPRCGHFVIATGPSPRKEKVNHCVVAEIYAGGFRVVHDPHPSRAGIKGEPVMLGLLVRSMA